MSHVREIDHVVDPGTRVLLVPEIFQVDPGLTQVNLFFEFFDGIAIIKICSIFLRSTQDQPWVDPTRLTTWSTRGQPWDTLSADTCNI